MTTTTTTALERIIMDEARQLANEKYQGHIPVALSILHCKLRNAGDEKSADVAFRLMEEITKEEEKKG
jgi:hypothetical protein